MVIVHGGDAGIKENAFSEFVNGMNERFEKTFNKLANLIQGKGPPLPPKDNVYVDTGFANVPGTAFSESTIDNVDDVKKRRITTQEPILTVYIKKRAFWGLKEENNSNFMDSGEKLFMRATKNLFERKCNQIASYEALTKLSKLATEEADFDAQIIDSIVTLLKEYTDLSEKELTEQINEASSESNSTLALALSDLKSYNTKKILDLIDAFEKLSQKSKKLRHATHTNWVIDPDQPDVHNLGRGSGVIELTLINSVNTSLGLENRGSFSLSIQDPLNIMKITSDDVELALATAHAESQLPEEKRMTGADSPSVLLDLARREEEKLRRIREDKIAAAFGIDRNAVGNTDVAEIVFEINPTSFAENRVVAYTTALDTPAFDQDSFRIAMMQLPVEQRLTMEEDKLVTSIFKLLNRYVSAIGKQANKILDRNVKEDVKHARRNMRIHYLGKSIIQPMDSVHIFIRGKTHKDGEVIGPLSNILNNSSFVENAARDRDVSDNVLREEMKQFGINESIIPLSFYKLVRTGSFMRNAGVHVFGGLVKTVSEKYNASSGAYTVDVSGESNLRWLNLSRVNTKPSLEQPQGLLEDPLTPFSIITDPATGLIKDVGKPQWLDSNKNRAETIGLKDKNGVFKGQDIDPDKQEQDRIPTNEALQIIYKHVPGMVYKWKQGVMATTINVNLKTSLQGRKEDTALLKRYAGLNIVNSPFASQDAADIISLLVTGFPHSIERFYENSKNIGTFTTAGSNASPSFFHSFFDITRSTNKSLGNFEPFRSIESGGTDFIGRLTLQSSLKKNYKDIESVREAIAAAEDQKIAINRYPVLPNESNNEQRQRDLVLKGLDNVISTGRAKITELKKNIVAAQDEAKKKGFIKGDTKDLVFRLNELPGGLETDAENEASKSVRMRNKILQLRTQYACKFNSDKNLLIISDEYDNDVDIQAYILKSASQQQNLFNSEYKFPYEICSQVAKTLDFEFFCNSQGNIIFRPPQYNKIPLSLILKMFLLNENNKTQLYPDFLKSLFESRQEGIKKDLEIIDLQIVEHALLLGNSGISSSKDNIDALVTEVTDGLKSSEIVSGQIIGVNQTSALTANVKSLAKKLVDTRYSIRGQTGYQAKIADEDAAEKEILKYNDPQNPQVNSLRLQLANKLTQLISKKQILVHKQNVAKKHGEKYDLSISKFDKGKLNDLLSPFQNLIEDDFNDFLGPGSSKRFIIYDDQIISSDFIESDENAVCRVDVNGEEDLIGGPGEIARGLPTLWAGATDFDMWRQYGYKSNGPVNKPFLKDAESQCAPYALFLLARNRKDIVRGRVTLYGNEYYQLGDVVYVNSRDTLYYVTDIRHIFSYDAGTFTTSLELRYGRPLGEYIPTPFDIIGKNLIRGQVNFNNILVSRETNSKEAGVHLGLVKFLSKESEDEYRAMLSDPLGSFNLTELQRILLVAKEKANSLNATKTFPKVEVRGWIADNKDRGKVQKRMNAVIEWLSAVPMGKWNGNGFDPPPSEVFKSESYLFLSKNQITNNIDSNIGPVLYVRGTDLEDEDLRRVRIPSEEVFNADINGEPYNTIEVVLVYE